MTDTSTEHGELLPYAQAAQRLNLGVLDVRRMVRAEQCPTVLDSRGRRRIPAAWIEDSQGWLNGTVADVRTGDFDHLSMALSEVRALVRSLEAVARGRACVANAPFDNRPVFGCGGLYVGVSKGASKVCA